MELYLDLQELEDSNMQIKNVLLLAIKMTTDMKKIRMQQLMTSKNKIIKTSAKINKGWENRTSFSSCSRKLSNSN